ncbi:MAG TPA: hypothetical protein VHA13_01885 [Gammaproteobacteria bacterium]|nr:hypothetical protein [Gammaproteobacteria bacterium]
MDKIIGIVTIGLSLSLIGCAAIQAQHDSKPSKQNISTSSDPSPNTWNDTNYRNMMEEDSSRIQQLQTVHTSVRR